MKPWMDMSYIEIQKIKDVTIKEKYRLEYFRYIYKISNYLLEELSKRNLSFEYSGSIYGMSIQKMYDELSNFCLEHHISKEEQLKIFYRGLVKDLIQYQRFEEARKICQEQAIPYPKR